MLLASPIVLRLACAREVVFAKWPRVGFAATLSAAVCGIVWASLAVEEGTYARAAAVAAAWIAVVVAHTPCC